MNNRRTRLWIDTAAAGAITVELLAECWLSAGFLAAHRVATSLAILLFGAAVALRGRAPAPALVGGCVVVAVQQALGGQLSASNGVGVLVGVALMCWSVSVSLPPRTAWATLLIGLLALIAFVAQTATSVGAALGGGVFIAASAFLAPSFVARLARERARRTAAFGELAEYVRLEQRELERATVAEERARIGTELQDIVAHSVSAMVVQAGAARQLVPSDPARAREAIVLVESTGREALVDLRRMLGVLRKEDDPRMLAPQPGLDELPALIGSLRSRGVRCTLRDPGGRASTTPGIDLVAYRVLEAALTGAARQGCTEADVAVQRERGLLELNLQARAPLSAVAGELEVLARRVELYDGSLTLKALGDERFALHARLPLVDVGPA